jgi:hypothetical protein
VFGDDKTAVGVDRFMHYIYYLKESRGNRRNETVETQGFCIIQDDRKVTQPILKYLLMLPIKKIRLD